MEKLVGYVRRSRERDNGFGLADQRLKIEQWAAYRSVDVIDVFEDDDVTGAGHAALRPAFGEAMAAIRNGHADGIVIAKFDRISRSVQDFAGLLKESRAEGWRLVCLDPEIDLTSSTGRAFAHMLSVFAEFERDQFVERMHGGRLAKAEAGGWPGGVPPFGWRVEDGALVRDDAEQTARRRMQRLRRKGLTLREIAAAMDKADVPTRRGGQWHPNGIARALKPR